MVGLSVIVVDDTLDVAIPSDNSGLSDTVDSAVLPNIKNEMVVGLSGVDLTVVEGSNMSLRILLEVEVFVAKRVNATLCNKTICMCHISNLSFRYLQKKYTISFKISQNLLQLSYS